MPSDLPARSPQVLAAASSALLVIDVQGKLLPAIAGHATVTWNIRRLLDGAALLGVPVTGTEQYPQGLGSTTPQLQSRLGVCLEKTTFSAARCPALCARLAELDRPQLVVAGIEAHVCVLQTSLDLISTGYRVYVVADAVGSRRHSDYDLALRRIESAGGTLITTEMALFEWCGAAGTPVFKSISALVKESPPAG